jgi:hypothetical protein
MCPVGATSALPADLDALLAEFTAIEADAEALVSALDDEQFNWSPRRGAWSIGQCLAHVNAANAAYMPSLELAVERARRDGYTGRTPIRSSLPGRWFIATLEPPVRWKLRAPAKIKPPAERRLKAEVWPEFVRFHAHMKTALTGMADVDLNRAAFVNPFLGRLVRVRAGTGLRIMAAHERRHVWQAWGVRKAEGFPR